jgi:glutathione S-transferase
MNPSTPSGSDPPLVVHGFASVWGQPSPSPFATKLETWLRMAGLPYRTALIPGRPRSKSGKFPYITTPDGRLISDSSVILETLTAERGVTLDAHLTPLERAHARMLQRTLEEHLYWTIVWFRWVRPSGFEHVRRDYFRHAPPVLAELIPRVARRGAKQQVIAQGVGRHDEARILTLAAQDLDAVDALLDDKDTVFGAPSSADALVFAFVGACLATPGDCPLAALARTYPRLVAHVERIHGRHWQHPAERVSG